MCILSAVHQPQCCHSFHLGHLQSRLNLCIQMRIWTSVPLQRAPWQPRRKMENLKLIELELLAVLLCIGGIFPQVPCINCAGKYPPWPVAHQQVVQCLIGLHSAPFHKMCRLMKTPQLHLSRSKLLLKFSLCAQPLLL
jgi:hypothetical protein